MGRGNAKVGIDIEATDKTGAAFAAARRNVEGLDDAVGKTTGGISGLATAFGAASIAAAAMGAGKAALELAELGAQTQTVRAQFENLASGVGESGDAILEALRGASRGAIADYDLMLAANKSLLLGVASSADDMTRLMEIARVRGAAMGLSVSQAFSDIITGLGRESPLILDNLGITVDLVDAQSRYAASLGKTAAALDATERKQALVNAVIQNSQSILAGTDAAMATSAEQIASLGAAWDNLKRSFGESLAPVLGPRMAELASFIQDQIQAEKEAAAQLKAIRLEQLGTELSTAQGELERRTAGKPALVANLLTVPFTSVEAATEQANRGIAEQADLVNRLTAEYQALRAAIPGDEIYASQIKMREAMLAANTPTEMLAANLGKLGTTGGPAAAAKQIGGVTAAAYDGVRALRQMLGTLNEMAARRDMLLQNATDRTAMVSESLDARSVVDIYDLPKTVFGKGETVGRSLADGITAGFVGGVGGGVSAAESAMADLVGRVAGVISSSRGDIGGVNPADFLPREDAVNENARRLADVMVQGFNSPWAAYFQTNFPALFAEIGRGGDIQSGAAEVLRQFQAGLRPELIDKTAVKDRVKAMLLGEQSAAALAQEIAAELATELGVSMAAAQQAAGTALGLNAAALGAAGLNADSGQFGASVLEGVDPASTAAKVTAGLIAAFNAQEKGVRDSGMVVGAWWGEGFLGTVGDNIPPGLLDLLTAKLLPAIIASLAAQDSQTTPADQEAVP